MSIARAIRYFTKHWKYAYAIAFLCILLYILPFFNCHDWQKKLAYLIGKDDVDEGHHTGIVYRVNSSIFTHGIYNLPVAIPLILGWNNDWGIPMIKYLLQGWNNMSQCPFTCAYTDDRALFPHASLILFFSVDNFDGLPQHRRPNQLFTFYSYEPPTFSNEYKRVSSNFFNITFTYRPDSDVPYKYDWLDPRDGTESPDKIWTGEQIELITKQKSDLLLWLVSNCDTNSKREKYVKELQKHANITLFGACNGDKRWSCKGECEQKMFDSHFFYLAFENSVCLQYVTEKFWNFKRLIVPVVLTRKVFSGLNIPDDAYIAADEFDNPKQLADYLRIVASNSTHYMSYFDWTKRYLKTSNAPAIAIQSPLCKLCKFAIYQRQNTPKQKYIMPNIVDFWERKSQCISGFANDLLNNRNH